MSRSKDNIKLHPKYGLNPSVEVCFWCGKETNAIILFGGEIKEEAPRTVTGSYEPCDKCSKKWELGFVLIEASNKPNIEGQPSMQEGVYPTGNYMVLTDDAALRLFGQDHANKGAAFADLELFRKFSECAKGPSKEDDKEL